MNSSIKYWLWLSTRRGLSAMVAYQLYHGFDCSIEKLYLCQEPSLQGFSLGKNVIAQLLDKDLREAEGIFLRCQKCGQDILTLQDALYPSCLKTLKDPPVVLYSKGKLPLVDDVLSVTMVGARDASPYGVYEAMNFAMGLTQSGAVLVTGMAQGIDSAVVEGALKAGGPVISVVAGGIDCVFPRDSARYYEDVPKVGVILSEYPPGTAHKGSHFRPRNRLLCGLSDGVFVVECNKTGGTMMTASLAIEQERDLFAMPSSVRSPMGEGPHLLIQREGAMLMSKPEDFVWFYKSRYPFLGMPLEERTRRSRVEEAIEHIPRQTPKVKKQSKSQDKQEVKETADRPKVRGEKAIETVTVPVATAVPLRKISREEEQTLFTDDQLQILRLLQGKQLSMDFLAEESQIPAKRLISAVTLMELAGDVAEVATAVFESRVELER